MDITAASEAAGSGSIPDGRKPCLHVQTPTVLSRPLSSLLGRDVYLKLENCQPTGSFKLRGIGALCAEAAAGGAKRFVSSSGGNAGLAAAYAGRELGIPTTVCVPEPTPDFIRDRLRGEGAEVIVRGQAWDDAHQAALEQVREKSAFYVHPFDHPAIWRGNSTLVDELTSQVPKPGLVVVAVGGGGLLCGVLEGLRRSGWGDVTVLACETEGTASFAAAFAAGKLVTLASVSGAATSLGARTVTAKVLDWLKFPLRSFVATDRAAVTSCLSFLDDHRFLVEPACGAALAAVYGKAVEPAASGPVVVIVCGGAVVTRRKLEALASGY